MTWITVDPWITWVWTVWVHIYLHFFSVNTYHSAPQSTAGWNTVVEPWIWRTNCWFSTMRGQEEIRASNSHFLQGSIIFVMYIAHSRTTNKKVKKKWKKKGTQIICWERRKNRIITCSNKTTKVREIVEHKNRNNNQWQQKENSYKYGRHQQYQ